MVSVPFYFFSNWKLTTIREGPPCPNFNAIWSCVTPDWRRVYTDCAEYVISKGWDWVYPDDNGSLKTLYEDYYARNDQRVVQEFSCLDREYAFCLVSVAC